MNSGIDGIVDEIDRKILYELQKDVRTSVAELARRVGLSPSAAAARLARLEDDQVIRGYRVDIDPRALGYNFMLFTRMACDGERYKQFLAHINSIDAIRECYHITGSDALIMKILVHSVEELNELVMKFLPYGAPNSSIVIGDVLVRQTYNLDAPEMKKSHPYRSESVRLG